MKSKTFWTSLAGIVGSLLLWWTGKLSANEALAAIWAALQALWFRDSMVKSNLLVAQTVAATAKQPDVVVVTPPTEDL